MRQRCHLLPALLLVASVLALGGCIESNPQPSPLGDDTGIIEPPGDTSLEQDQNSWTDDGIGFDDLLGDISAPQDVLDSGACELVDCSGHGNCVEYGNQPHCVCDPGWMNSTAVQCVPLPEGHWCSLDGWCFEYPRIPPYTLQTLYAPVAGEVWALGEWGVLLRGDGLSGTVEFLDGLYDVNDVVGFGPDQVMAVGSQGTYAMFRDGAWTMSAIEGAGELLTVGGFRPDELMTAWGGWDEDPYNPQYQSHVLQWDGVSWTEIDAPGNGYRVISLDASQDDQMILGGYFSHQMSDTQPPAAQTALFYWTGEKWENLTGTTLDDKELVAMEVLTKTEVWLVTTDAPLTFSQEWPVTRLYAWNGTSATEVAHLEEVAVTDLYCPEPGVVWMATFDGRMYRWNGAALEEFTLPAYPIMGVMALAGTGPNDIWASGNSGILFHWDGLAWSGLQKLEQTTELAALTGTGPNDVWAVGGFQASGVESFSQSMHWDGQEWQHIAMDSPPALTAAHAIQTDDVWAVGGSSLTSQALVGHWNGALWEFQSLPDYGMLNGVWGASSDEVWAVGSGSAGPEGLSKAVILRGSDGEWSKAKDVEDAMLFGAWGVASNDVWTWGSLDGEALALHWEGEEWTQTPMGVSGLVIDVAGTEADDLWALVYWCTAQNECGGRVLRWDGFAWSQVWESLEDSVRAMTVHSSQDVWVFGVRHGFHWDGTQWTPFVPIWPSLADAAVFGEDLWAVGSLAAVRKSLYTLVP